MPDAWPVAQSGGNPPAARPSPSRLEPTMLAAQATMPRLPWWAPLGLVVVTVLAYANSFTGIFLFDDTMWVGDPVPAFQKPMFYIAGLWESGGRRLVYLSAAINFALCEASPWGWHAFNLSMHVLTGLTLFGIIRRTLLSAPLRERCGAAALPLAWTITAIWMIHPLTTESVTYIWQRAQAMMGLFQFLAMYAFIRGCGSPSRRWAWWAGSLLAADLALDTKPQMVALPLLLLVYDRTFLSGGWRRSLDRHWQFYTAMAVLWAITTGKMVSGFGEVGSDVGVRGVIPGEAEGAVMGKLEYARAQAEVVSRYLGLAFWPDHLCLDYVWETSPWSWRVLPFAALIASLVAVTGLAMWRWPLWGFLGAWFFLNLGPSSSFVPRPDVMVEHRMYVPLVALVALVVLGGWQLVATRMPGNRAAGQAAAVATAVLMLALGVRTWYRNTDYHDHVVMWTKVVELRPHNPRAHLNLGTALGARDRHEEALEQFAAAIKIMGRYPMAHYNRGTSLEKLKRNEEAVEAYREATRENQGYAEAWNNLGGVLITLGRPEEALVPLQRAITLRENQQAPYGVAYNNYGNALIQLGKAKEARPFLEKAVLYRPMLAEAWYNLGNADVAFGEFDKALPAYQEAVKIHPEYAEAHHNLALMLGNARRYREAYEQDRQALLYRPVYDQAQHTIQRWELAMKQGGAQAPAVGLPAAPAAPAVVPSPAAVAVTGK